MVKPWAHSIGIDADAQRKQKGVRNFNWYVERGICLRDFSTSISIAVWGLRKRKGPPKRSFVDYKLGGSVAGFRAQEDSILTNTDLRLPHHPKPYRIGTLGIVLEFA